MAEAMNVVRWDGLTEAELDAKERAIAAKYMRIFPWGAVLWGIGNTLIWLALWPLVFMDLVPLWVAAPIAFLNVTASYLPSHEAQHSIIAREGQPLRWLNELVGHVALIPRAASFQFLRYTHFEHHRHTNNPELDPDISIHAPNRKAFFFNACREILMPSDQRGASYQATLERVNRPDLVLPALLMRAGYMLVLLAAAVSGHALEAALLWWLPLHFAQVYTDYYLSWKPHHPGEETSRYRDTRSFGSNFGNIGSSGMQYHIVHHLYPRIPLMQTPAAYRELLPILQRKGCQLDL